MLREINNIRNKSARFYKSDFHIHSPLSPDWNKGRSAEYGEENKINNISNPKLITDEILEKYSQALLKKDLKVVAITDHMRYSFGIKLAEYAKRKNLSLVVFPGIELNVKIKQPLINNFRIHIIAIFPPDVSGERIERIFPSKVKGESEGRGSGEDIECGKLEDILKKIREIGGIHIAAHIYNQNGARYAYTKSAELALEPLEELHGDERDNLYKKVGDSVKEELCKFDCLQVKSTTEPIHFLDDNGELRIPLILSSDAHFLEKMGEDESVSFVKLGEPDFSCLKEAFKFPDTRIRFKSNLPESKPPRILGVRTIGNQDNIKSFFKNTNVGFSDNLTCLIGPRGSGKSALIDSIRYAMGYNRTLDEVKKVKDQVIDRQRNTLQESKVEVFYEKKDGTIHRIESTYDSREQYNTKIYDLDGNELNIQDIERCGDYPLNLYGWNELELLGEAPKSQRENLDKFIEDLKPLKEEKKEYYEKLAENRNKCQEQLEKLDEYFEEKGGRYPFVRLKEYEKQFKKLNTPEIEKKFKVLDEVNQKLSFLEEMKQVIEETLESIQRIEEVDYEFVVKKYHEISPWCTEFLEKRIEIKKTNDFLLKGKSELRGRLEGLKDILEKEIETLTGSKNSTAKDIRSAIGEQEAISADLRNSAKKRYDSAKTEFDSYKLDVKTFEDLVEERNKIINDIKKQNKQIFATRNEETSKIEEQIGIIKEDEFKIELKLKQGNDRVEFLTALEENEYKLQFHGNWKNKKISSVIVDKFNPLLFSEVLLQKNSSDLLHSITLQGDSVSETYEIDKEYAQRFINENRPYDEVEDLSIRRYDKEVILKIFKIQEILFDDEFYIELNGKPIQFCSPGQRCSAMLPIVTLTSDAPLIIDQPEDNLDNRLVSRAIFKILSKLKETRQIIVATHNPNILVSGDSEQVIVFKSDGALEDYGSIDKASIVKNVIELMEGGKEAFERRNIKYGNYLKKA